MSPEAPRDLSRFNLIASATLVGVGLLTLLYLIPAHIPAARALDQGLSARFMPTLAASVLTMLAFLLGVSVILRRARGQPPLDEDNEDNEIQCFGLRETVNALILLAGAGVYVVLFQAIGFVAASALALFACLLLGGVRNWLLLGLVSLGLPLAISELLWRALLIIMPPFPFFS